MALELNEPTAEYKEFYGRNVEQMPKLIAEGRVPMSVADILQRRLDVREDSGDVRAYWIDKYLDTGDAVYIHNNGDVKIVLDDQSMWGINAQTRLKNGAVPVTDEQWEKFTGDNVLLVPKKRTIELQGRLYNQDAVKDSEEWNFLARNHNRLVEYADVFFPEMKSRFKYDENMGLFLPLTQETPIMRALYVSKLGTGSYAGCGLIDGFGRLIGVAPEA